MKVKQALNNMLSQVIYFQHQNKMGNKHLL